MTVHRRKLALEVVCNGRCGSALWPEPLKEGDPITSADIAWALEHRDWRAADGRHFCPECQAKKT